MKRKTPAIDATINALFRIHGQNKELRLLEMPSIWTAGRAAHAAGQDVTAAVIAAIEKARA